MFGDLFVISNNAHNFTRLWAGRNACNHTTRRIFIKEFFSTHENSNLLSERKWTLDSWWAFWDSEDPPASSLGMKGWVVPNLIKTGLIEWVKRPYNNLFHWMKPRKCLSNLVASWDVSMKIRGRFRLAVWDKITLDSWWALEIQRTPPRLPCRWRDE